MESLDLNFDSEIDFMIFFENAREVMSIQGNCDISLIDWYKIPLLDSIVSNKQMVEYLLLNNKTKESKSFVLTKHKDSNKIFVISQKRKEDTDINNIVDCYNSRIDKICKEIMKEIN